MTEPEPEGAAWDEQPSRAKSMIAQLRQAHFVGGPPQLPSPRDPTVLRSHPAVPWCGDDGNQVVVIASHPPEGAQCSTDVDWLERVTANVHQAIVDAGLQRTLVLLAVVEGAAKDDFAVVRDRLLDPRRRRAEEVVRVIASKEDAQEAVDALRPIAARSQPQRGGRATLAQMLSHQPRFRDVGAGGAVNALLEDLKGLVMETAPADEGPDTVDLAATNQWLDYLESGWDDR